MKIIPNENFPSYSTLVLAGHPDWRWEGVISPDTITYVLVNHLQTTIQCIVLEAKSFYLI